VLFSVAGLLVTVILFTVAGIAAPLFIIMVALVFIPWLLFTTERLHDRGKSVVARGVLPYARRARPICESCMFTGIAGTAPHYALAVTGSTLRSGDLSKLAACAAPLDRTHMGRTHS
jgi:uncharacterized membrane protein YhaH (DUF805 family)